MQTKLVGLGTNCQLNYRLKTSNFMDMILAERWCHWKIAETFPAAYVLPRIYALPKVHKPDCPFQIITSSLDSSLYPLAAFLHEIIARSPKPTNHIKNNLQLIHKLQGTVLDNDIILISLDIVLLFTNIPLDLARKCVAKRWKYLERLMLIPKKEFLNALEFILDSLSKNLVLRWAHLFLRLSLT